MSVNQDTGSDSVIEASVGIDTAGCFSVIDDHLIGVEKLRAVYRPAQTRHGLRIPATVTLRIGQMALTLTPEVWAAVNDAVREVLPIDVVPA